MDDEQLPQDGMADTPDMQGEQPPTNKQKIWSKKNLLIIVPLVVLAAGAGVLGYLAHQQSDRASSLAADVTQLEETVATKDTRIAELLDANADAVPDDDEDDSSTPAHACDSGTTYTADIGEFEITLDSPYAIMRNLDAAFEGGPATSLNIVTCLDDETNVFDNQPQHEVSILANPSISAADLQSVYESNAGNSLNADGTITIDGVTADKYTLDGLFLTTVMFFDHGGIGYQIELASTNDTTNAILTDLTDGWSFTP